MLGLPNNRIGVEVSCGVKPEMKLLLSVPFALSEDIGVQNVGVTTKIPQELEVDLIMSWPLRRQLQNRTNKTIVKLLVNVREFFEVFMNNNILHVCNTSLMTSYYILQGKMGLFLELSIGRTNFDFYPTSCTNPEFFFFLRKC